MVTIKDKDFETFISKEKIAERVAELGKEIAQDYQGKIPLLIGVLNGSFMFTADLIRAIPSASEVAFVRYSSYHAMESTGIVTEIMGFNEKVRGREVILVEDIVDSGLTLQYLKEKISAFQPKSVKVASLLFKPKAIKTNATIDYVGFEIENQFVVGYGLDYGNLGRELDAIYVLKE